MPTDFDRWRVYIAVEHSFHADGRPPPRTHAHSIVSFFSFSSSFFEKEKKTHIYRLSPTVWLLGRKKQELRRHCLHVIHVLCLTMLACLLVAMFTNSLKTFECNIYTFLFRNETILSVDDDSYCA
jgi:hypothetical protein